MLECAGFFDHIPRDQLFVSVHDAVLVALENNPVLLEQVSKLEDEGSQLWPLLVKT